VSESEIEKDRETEREREKERERERNREGEDETVDERERPSWNERVIKRLRDGSSERGESERERKRERERERERKREREGGIEREINQYNSCQRHTQRHGLQPYYSPGVGTSEVRAG
jgi:hypothetical protein